MRGKPAVLNYLLPRLQDVFFLAIFLGVVMLGPRLFHQDGDLGRHVTIGEYILRNKTIPTRDIFSHTMAGEPLTPHEWLAQVVFALAHRFLGLDGVVLLSALILAFTFTLCYRQCHERTGLVLVALAFAILAAAAASLHWLARPHLFTMLFVVLWTWQLERIRRGDLRRWWILPVLMLVWANTHGAFIAGFVILAAYLIGELINVGTFKRLNVGTFWANPGLMVSPILKVIGLAGVLSFAASLINPVGLHLWGTSLGFLQSRYLVSHTQEYLPPNFHEPGAWPFLVMIVGSLVILAYQRWNVPTFERLNDARAAHILLLAGWTAMGLYSARNVPLYALIAAPILSGMSGLILRGGVQSGWFVRLNQRLAAVEATLRGYLWPVFVVILATLGLMGGARLDFEGKGNVFDPQVFPVQAVDWLEENPVPGRAFNYFPWGGYLLYRAWPDIQVFIDGQTDFYGEDLTRQYERVITLADGWEGVLEEYQVGWVLMPADSQLVRSLRDDPGWRVVYQDGTAAVVFLEP